MMFTKTNLRAKVIGAALLLVLWCVAAWGIARNYYLLHAHEMVRQGVQDAKNDVRNLAHSVRMNLDIMQGSPALVARLTSVQEAVAEFAAETKTTALPYPERKKRWTQDPTLSKASRMLDEVKANVSADAVSVLDAHGYCIASSDWLLPSSRVGKDYSDRPRFLAGKGGEGAIEYVLDQSNRVPALFFSYPIVVSGRLLGVAVVAIDLPSLFFLISTTEGYITDHQGVVVVASDKSLQWHALPGAGVNAMPAADREAIYNAHVFPELRMTSGKDHDLPELIKYQGEDTLYVVASADLGNYGLTVHVRERLTDLLEAKRDRLWLFLLLALVGGFVILVANFAAFYIQVLRTEKQALEESELRFRSLIEQSLTGFYVTQDDKIVYANPRMCEIVGWPLHEVLGRDSLQFFRDNPEGLQAIRESRARLAAGERTVSLVAPFTRKDGKAIEIGVHAALGLWDGRPAAFVMAADITERRRHEEKMAEYVTQLEQSMEGTLQAVSNMVEHRDPYTAGHERRVGVIAADIAAEMGWPTQQCKELELIGLVHDIGKIAIPAEILSKPARLTPVEYDLVKGHAERGYQILKDVEFPLPIAEIIRQHHERMDGSGYPRGLKGEEILPEARILAVADVVESMASHRPYRPAVGLDAALREIEQRRGTLYDPQVADALLRLIREKGYRMPD